MTKGQLMKAAARAKAYAAGIRERAEETIGQAFTAAEVVGTATAFGYARSYLGKDGHWKVSDVDVELAVGLGLHGLAFAGGLGRYDEHAHAVANGALACYGAFKGFDWGKTAKAKKTAGVRGAPQRLPERQPNMATHIPHEAPAFAG